MGGLRSTPIRLARMQLSLYMNTAIVTGANTGLGFECARALAETRDWHVVIACRSAEKGREAVKRLVAQTRHKEIEAKEIQTMTLDLASLESVRNFARDYAAERRPPLRAIVCNAATQIVTGRTFTKDGFETTFAVNHLGHFLLVNLMLAQMTPPAWIVVVSSGTHDPAQTTGMPSPLYRRARILARPDEDSKPLDDPQGTAGRRAYTTSKLCNVLFTYELDRRLRAEKAVGQNGASISVNAFACEHGHRAQVRAHLGKILPGRARRAVVQGLIRSSDGGGIVGVECRDGQADARRDDSKAQIDYLGSITVLRNTYPVVFSVDYIFTWLTLVNY